MKPTAYRSQARRVAYSIVLAALSIALSPISIPTGLAKLSPTQALINVLAAVLVGPWWGLGIALITSILRNMMGLGTPLAFPGSMFCVLLAGLLYSRTRSIYLTAAGEIIGTGVVGAVVGAWVIAPYIMGKSIELGVLILPFQLSSMLGAVLGIIGYFTLRRAGFVQNERNKISVTTEMLPSSPQSEPGQS